jgi:hypothetical protein
MSMGDAEASLTACRDAQGTAIDALQGSDKTSLLSALESAQASCRAAADALRRTPVPDHPAAAKGLDQAVAGFAQVEQAVKIIDRSPALAQRKARAGVKAITAGLKEAEE